MSTYQPSLKARVSPVPLHLPQDTCMQQLYHGGSGQTTWQSHTATKNGSPASNPGLNATQWKCHSQSSRTAHPFSPSLILKSPNMLFGDPSPQASAQLSAHHPCLQPCAPFSPYSLASPTLQIGCWLQKELGALAEFPGTPTRLLSCHLPSPSSWEPGACRKPTHQALPLHACQSLGRGAYARPIPGFVVWKPVCQDPKPCPPVATTQCSKPYSASLCCLHDPCMDELLGPP